MKKIVFFAVLMLALTVCAFAQSYTVQSVTGRVQQEKGGSRVEVKAGEILSGDTVIYTGIGASIVLKEGDKTFTIKAARNGKVSEPGYLVFIGANQRKCLDDKHRRGFPYNGAGVDSFRPRKRSRPGR